MLVFLELFLTFFMIGAFTFGGGYAMIPLLQEQVGLHWGDLIPPESIQNFIGISESTPGPFAINMATYVGSAVGGQNGNGALAVFGAFCSTLGVVLPSFLIILIVAKAYEKFKTNRIVKGCMTGLKPATVGLIAGAILDVVIKVFFPAGWAIAVFTDVRFYINLAIFGVMTLLAFKKVHPIIIICLSAAIGIATGYLPV